MALFSREDIVFIVKQKKMSINVISWSIENYSDKLIGYLGEHLKLTVIIETNGNKLQLKYFVKCMPRFDEWKAEYLKEAAFFKKEYVMLNSLFKNFRENNGSKWRPKLLFAKENVFVFEDVAELGYRMPSHLETLNHKEVLATIATIAKFHAQSYIYEEKKSRELDRVYRIWEDYSEYLQEPPQLWRDVGRNAVMDYLKVYSSYKSEANFVKNVDFIIPKLYENALTLMKPSSTYRNTIVHRDLWTNNIFLKENSDGNIHALIIDYQTVIYCSPLLDISSLLYFNTTRSYRDTHVREILDTYYEVLSKELESEGIEVSSILKKTDLTKAYEDSILFGITQAAIIVPITAMSAVKREELFANPEKCAKMNNVSRSKEFIEIAREDATYRTKVTEIFDEIVERFVYPKNVFTL